MIGSFNNGRNHYRCTYAAEYPDANLIAHPLSLYVREDKIVDLVDPWISRAFSASNLPLQAMAGAQHDDADHRIIAGRGDEQGWPQERRRRPSGTCWLLISCPNVLDGVGESVFWFCGPELNWSRIGRYLDLAQIPYLTRFSKLIVCPVVLAFQTNLRQPDLGIYPAVCPESALSCGTQA